MLYLSNVLSIQIDEAFSLNTSANSLIKVLRLSYNFEGQPPVYFMVLALWRKINDGIFFARLLSAIFTLLSAVGLEKVLRLIFEKIYTRWIIVLFLLNPFTVWASLEIRTYSLVVLLTLTAVYFFYLIYYYNKKSHKIVFILICIIGVYTQYYFVFLIISFSFVFLVSKGWRSFFNYILLVIPVAIFFLPNLLFIRDEYAMHQNNQVVYTIVERLKNIFYAPEQFIFPTGELPVGRSFRWISRIFFGVLIFNAFYHFFKANTNDKSKDFRSIIEILILISSMLLIFLLVFVSSSLIYNIKYLSIIFPFLCLLCSVFCIYHSRYKNTIFGFLSLLYLLVLINSYKQPFIKTTNSKSVAHFVKEIEKPQEPILFYIKSLVLPFKNYYEGNNPLIPLPVLVFDYNYFSSDIKDTIEFDNLIRNSVKNSKSFIFISGTDLGAMNMDPLANNVINLYFKNNYDIPIDTIMEGKYDYEFLRVRRLKKK